MIEWEIGNKFLQERFGGVILPHGRDTEQWNPARFDRAEIREELGVHDRRVVTFFGTPRPHKGQEDLIEAVSRIKDPDTLLMLIGLGHDEYSERIAQTAEERLGSERVKVFGQQPFDKVPEFIVAADVVAVPQRAGPASIGQMPAKVYDAMAMARPIVATRVSDLPDALDGCGWIVEPERPDDLADAIEYILSHPEEAGRAGAAARRKCQQKYSFEAMETILESLIAKHL